MNPETRIRENLALIIENISEVQNRIKINKPVTIVGVTKTHPFNIIESAANAGLDYIGENRIQEAAYKFPKLKESKSVKKRMIGHLQSNKINKAISLFDTIDSVDSLKLAKSIDTKLDVIGKKMRVLLEINTSGETQKNGFNVENLDDMLACLEGKNTIVAGLMTIGPLTNIKQDIRSSFVKLRKLLEEINGQKPENHHDLNILSMGMSGDYLIAVEEGSNMIRLGSAIFGPRRKV